MIADADGWQVAVPKAVGLDSAPLRAFEARFTSFAEANLHSMIVVRRGALVFERYFVGEDQIWGAPIGPVEFRSDTKHDLRSITKSVTSLLIGIEGRVRALPDEQGAGDRAARR
jgi:hypothetical protein